jgi:hypothetical protein
VGIPTPRGVVAGREQEEGNRITQWIIRFPSGDRRGGDPLVLGFGGGERSRDKSGFRSVVARVGDEGAVTEMFRSIMVPPWGGAEASYWLIPAPPLAGTLQTGYPRV